MGTTESDFGVVFVRSLLLMVALASNLRCEGKQATIELAHISFFNQQRKNALYICFLTRPLLSIAKPWSTTVKYIFINVLLFSGLLYPTFIC